MNSSNKYLDWEVYFYYVFLSKIKILKNEQGLGKPFKKPTREHYAFDGGDGSFRYSLFGVEHHGSEGD